MKQKLLIACLLLTFQVNISSAQVDSITLDRISELEKNINAVKAGGSSFLLTGFTNLTYHQGIDDLNISRFTHAGFSPIGIWKPSEKVFFEAELHIELEGGIHGGEIAGSHGHGDAGAEPEINHEGSTHIDLGYANMVYLLSSKLTLTAGKFLTPIGIYNERYHPTWINLMPLDPLGMGHGGPLPAAELGIQARGAFQTGSSKLTYVLYLSNGPILEEGNVNDDDAGKLIYTNFSDNNANKALGGRFGFLPLSNSSLEIGLSGQYAGKIGDNGTRYEDVSASIYALDFTYNKNISGLGLLRLSGQYASVNVGDIDYLNPLDQITAGAPIFYNFNNTSTYYYSIGSIRPIQSSNTFLRNSELAVRYSGGTTPEGSKWHVQESRTMIGYVYWLHARTAFKVAAALGDTNALYAQIALGF